MTMKKFFLLFILINAIVSILACNNLISPRETGDSIKDVAPTKTIETTTNENKNTNQRKQFIRLWSDPATLDPHLTTDATSASIIVEIFGGLVTINPDMEIVPDLASRWEVENNGLSYIFHLNNNATFHDGKSVTALDFKWSFERASNPSTGSPVADEYLGDIIGVSERLKSKTQEVEGIQVIDDYTLKINIDAPKSYFIAKLTYPTGFVLDKNNVESSRQWFLNPNGTGAFKLAQYTPGENLILKANKNYHLGAPHIDTARYILSGGTAMLMYENDEIDITGVGLADLDRILDPSSPLNKDLVKRPPTFQTSYLGMNSNMPPLDDVNIRLALNHAINREEISKVVLADLVVPAKGILPPGFPAYNKNLTGYEYDLEKAKKLIKNSKYGNNIPIIKLSTAGNFGASSVNLDLEVIIENWKALGITVEIQQTDWATFLQDLYKNRYQMFQIGWVADYPDPQNFLDILFHSNSSSNHTGYSNSKVDALLEQARTEQNKTKRFEMYNSIEEKILADAPWVPLWHSAESYILIKPRIKNFKISPLIIPNLRYIEIVE